MAESQQKRERERRKQRKQHEKTNRKERLREQGSTADGTETSGPEVMDASFYFPPEEEP